MVDSNRLCCGRTVGWEDDWTYYSRGDDFLYEFHGHLVRRRIFDYVAQLGDGEAEIRVGCEGFC